MNMKYDRSKPWIRRIFSGKNGIILAITALAFIFLNVYRMNTPLSVGNKIPDFSLETQDGRVFKISDIKTPVVLVFYKKHKAFSNFIFNSVYRRMLPELKFLQDNNYAQVIVLVDGYKKGEQIATLAEDKEHLALKTTGYAADTSKIAALFGVRSWPHIFVINDRGIVIYESKLAGADHIQKILWRN